MSGHEFPCVDEGFARNEPVDVVIRPEDIMIVGEDVGQLTGVVRERAVQGRSLRDDGRHRRNALKVHSTTMQPAGSPRGPDHRALQHSHHASHAGAAGG